MIVFRENMYSFLSLKKAEFIYGSSLISDLDWKIKGLLRKDIENSAVKRKVGYLKENLHIFDVMNLVQFIGISGSVAAGTAKEDDDIDLFIVVRNGTGWLYRGLLLLKNVFNRKIRMGGGISVRRHEGLGGRFRDKFCINLIVEEKGLKFDEDIFIFHELMHLIPVYNESYFDNVLASNSWITRFGASSLNPVKNQESREVNLFIRLLNRFSFVLQLLYRVLMLHKINLKDVLESYREGKITFYPADFKSEVLEEFERKYNEKLNGLFGSKAD